MNRVECSVEEVETENDNGRTQPAVCVTCKDCGHAETSLGTSDRSIKRCLALLRENCPNKESNYYLLENED